MQHHGQFNEAHTTFLYPPHIEGLRQQKAVLLFS